MVEVANPGATASGRVTNKTIGATVGSGVGGAVATIVIWLINRYGLPADMPLPGAVEGAITTILGAGVTFLGGYYTPHGADEAVLRTADGTIVSGR
jgi:hypothetical protein